MLCKIRKRLQGEGGFTLIELLVVIIIIAILAAIAIPTFLGQRNKAQEAAAKSLVRNAMTAVESAYVDVRDFSAIDMVADPNALEDIEPSIVFIAAANAATAPTADAQDNEVNVSLTGAATYEVGSVAQSGTSFGVAVDKSAGGGNTFYVGGTAQDW